MKAFATVVIGILSVMSPLAHAGTLALDIIENPASTGTAGSSSLGWQFAVNSTITVDGLAFWDHTMTQNHDVGIWDSSQLLLTSATVLTSDPQAGTGPWRVHSITPIVLGPGTYYIAGVSGADNYTYNPTSTSTIPEVTFLSDRFVFGATTLQFPTDTSGVTGWFGPSFTVSSESAVPEPATMSLFAVGALALAAIARKRG